MTLRDKNCFVQAKQNEEITNNQTKRKISFLRRTNISNKYFLAYKEEANDSFPCPNRINLGFSQLKLPSKIFPTSRPSII